MIGSAAEVKAVFKEKFEEEPSLLFTRKDQPDWRTCGL